VICLDDKWLSPKVRPSVAHNLDKADEFTLVGHKLGLMRGNVATEDGDRSAALMEDGSKS
jgi:hypothetical protein